MSPNPLSARSLRACAALVVAAPVALVGVTTAPAAAAAETGTAASTPTARGTDSRFLKLWNPEWMARRKTAYSPAELTEVANRFALIASMPNKFKKVAASMKATNPDLKFVVYKNATFGNGTKHPADLYAKNASGGKVAAKDWPTTFVMKLDDPRWVSEVKTKCELLVRTSLYDGCFLDVLGYGPLVAPRYLLSKPVHANGTPWSALNWITWSERIAETVQASPGIVTGNGLGEGKRYFDATAPTSRLVAGLDGAMSEIFMRGPQDSLTRFPSETEWLQDVRMLGDVESRGSYAMTTTKIWLPATTAQVDQWHRFTVGSFMLGSNGKSMMCFLRDKSQTSTMMDHRYNDVEIGTPTGAFAKVNGLYQRNFTRGRVLVNTGSTPITVSVSGSYRNMDGARVASTVTIPAHDAQILTIA